MAKVEKKDQKAGEQIVAKKVAVRNKRIVDKASIVTGFKVIEDFIDEEMKRLKNSEEKGRQYLRRLSKQLRVLAKDTNKVMGIRKPRNKNVKSGIMKPVKITTDLAEFTGWDEDGRYSRVEVTRFVCNYITEKNLQNPNLRKEIFPDKPLAKLLRYEASKETKPLTYTRIQQLIQIHFIKEQPKKVPVKGSIKVKPLGNVAEKVDKIEKVEKVEKKVEKVEAKAVPEKARKR